MNLIFIGKSGLFKKEMALAKAREILSVKNLDASPDFLLVEPENQKIPVAQVTRIADFTTFAPVNAERKVVVIVNADLGTIEFQQALLKLLEDEPKTDFLLTCQQNLLETIHSRCSQVQIKCWTRGQLEEWLKQEGIAVDETAMLLCGGRPGIYREVVSETAFLADCKQLAENLINAPERAVIQLGALAESFDIGVEKHTLIVSFIESFLSEHVLQHRRLTVGQVLASIEICTDERRRLGKRGYGKTEMFCFYRKLYAILSGQQ